MSPQPAGTSEKPRLFTFVRQTEVWLISGVWWVIFGLPFLQFCLNVVESTALGQQRVPRLTAAGLKDARVYALLLISTCIVSVHALASAYLVPGLVLGTDVLMLLIYPAMIASIALRHSLFTTLNPLFIGRFVRQMGLGYAGLRVVFVNTLIFLLLLAQTRVAAVTTLPGTLLFTTVAVYLVLVMSRCTGALLHARRQELGLKTVHSDEQENEKARRAEQLERRDFLAPVLEHSRVNRYRQAWEVIEPRLKQDRYATEHLFYEELRAWTDRTLAHKLAQGYLKRLVETSTEHAWRIYEDIYNHEQGNYRLESGETVLRLAETTSTDAQRRIILETLKYFDDDFPQHPKSRQALLLGADLAFHFDELDLAAALFRKVRTRKGLVHASTFQRVQNLLAHHHKGG